MGTESTCNHYRRPFNDCHNEIFGEYCSAVTMCHGETFCSLVDRYKARKYFIKKYNSVLNFYIFQREGIVQNDTMKLPPPCLRAEMEDVMKEIGSQYRDDAMRKEEFRVGE